MAEVINKAIRILERMEKKGLYSTEHISCAKEIICSYPIFKIRERIKKTHYKYVAASLWLTGCIMGEKYYRTYHQILTEVIGMKFGVYIATSSAIKTSKGMVSDPNVKKTILEIWESYGKQEIPVRVRELNHLKRS